MASFPEASKIKSPPGWVDAKDVMSRTMWRVVLVGPPTLGDDDDEDSWSATHADDGEACAASSDLVMLLSIAPPVGVSILESVAVDDEEDLALAAAAWLGLHMVIFVSV